MHSRVDRGRLSCCGSIGVDAVAMSAGGTRAHAARDGLLNGKCLRRQHGRDTQPFCHPLCNSTPALETSLPRVLTGAALCQTIMALRGRCCRLGHIEAFARVFDLGAPPRPSPFGMSLSDRCSGRRHWLEGFFAAQRDRFGDALASAEPDSGR